MKEPTLVSGLGTTTRLIEVITHLLFPFGIFPLSLAFGSGSRGSCGFSLSSRNLGLPLKPLLLSLFPRFRKVFPPGVSRTDGAPALV